MQPIITSRQNPLVKLVCGLSDKKKRTEHALFRFDGVKLLCEALSADIKIKYVICHEDMDRRAASVIERSLSEGNLTDEQVVYVSDSVFEKMSEEKSPEGVITVAQPPQKLHVHSDALPSGRLLIAESLRDPGNLGTVMRSAYALGIDTLVLTDDCADLYNPRTIRAAMGAVFKARVQTVSKDTLGAFISRLRESGRRVFATALAENALEIGSLDLSVRDCFVIGNEGHGLCQSTVDACDAAVIIPMREDAESLNAAAAATICIWATVTARG